MESVIFRVSFVVKKSIVCLTISEKKTSEVPRLFFMSCP